MDRILDAIDHALAGGKSVYVHCWGGVGRTGTVVGCYLVRHGATGSSALDTLARLWSGVEKCHRMPHCPETAAQRRFVADWKASR